MSDTYDPYIPNKSKGSEKTTFIQNQVDDVVGLMNDNIEKLRGRGERLEDLQNKTRVLEENAGQFSRTSNQVRKRMWWKDMKWKIILTVTILLILGAIIGSVVGTMVTYFFFGNNGAQFASFG